MSNVSVSQSWIDDVQRERQEMLRKLERNTEQLRQKDETIRALAAMLERMTHTATGLHLLYRITAKPESDGSHEKLFSDALALAEKARMP